MIRRGHAPYARFGKPQWRHTEECIQVHYAQPPRVVEQGFTVLGEELRRAYT